jgi:secreted trypsin-like serine protease
MGTARRRFAALTAVVLLVVALTSGVANGIVYGEPDNGEHPFVGSMVLHLPDYFGPGEDLYAQVCSGTLLEGSDAVDGRDVFLTAAHCVFDLDTYVPPGGEMLVTFDESISPTATYYAGDAYWDERFVTEPGFNDAYDVGVIVLDGAPGVGHAELAPSAYLTDKKKSGELKNMTFTTVGYGTIRETRTTGFAGILDNVDRNQADQGFLSLTKAWLTLSMNQATGNGGTCYGDSGGPHFVEGTYMVVSVTSTGDAPCKAADKTYRVDTESARGFLGDFVDLP